MNSSFKDQFSLKIKTNVVIIEKSQYFMFKGFVAFFSINLQI